jgi:hypothetical protein
MNLKFPVTRRQFLTVTQVITVQEPQLRRSLELKKYTNYHY